MRPRALSVLALLMAATVWAELRPLTLADIGRSERVPSVGRALTYTVRLQALAGESVAGPVTVTLTANGQEAAQAQTTLAADAPAELRLTWTPAADGWHALRFQAQTLAGQAVAVDLRVPVTARPLYFVWFGAPQRFAWCNVPTTVDASKPAEVAWWQWHGGIPCAWRGGVCYLG